ncbi:DUF4333 domain-containing protein [Saccharopolyspora flava]|uniref:DUF4333 domain-containing protein n=1 Tax=Saccharopolyspora flava TaxID=95161 RepID=A0A1I6RZW8_9PSEU|nr:DUF4333 domain-containing protein [Saccharopolyspora flava]SFS70241.1 protein of unknown function [Saccharopolyspora flava]
MSSPYGPPGGYPQWGQQPQGPGMQPGGMPQGQPQPGAYGAPQPVQQQPMPPQPVPQQPLQPQQPQPQQPQYGQPYGYGQPQSYYPSPDGFGFPQVPPKKPGRSKLPWILGGAGALVVVVAIVLVLGFVAPGFFVRPVFDAASVEKGVAQTLKGSYSLAGVGAVTCPDGQPVQAQHRFDCQVQINGQNKTVTVTVKDEDGVYEVGHPK